MIYFLQRADGAVKIGTTNQYHNRLYSLSLEFGNLSLLGLMDGDRAVERQIHQMFPETQIGKSEWFLESEALSEYIRANTHLSVPPIAPNVKPPRVEKVVKGHVRNRLPQLIEAKQQREQRMINTSQLADEIGISRPTLYKWLDNHVDRFDAKVCDAFCHYFNCEYGELLYVEFEKTG